jgi:outer membrane protein
MRYILLIGLTLAVVASGQEKILTLAQAESLACKGNLGLLIQQQSLMQSRYRYLSSFSSFLPTASTSLNFGRTYSSAIDFDNNSATLGAYLSVNLFDNIISTRVSKISKDISQLSYDQYRADLITTVVDAYFGYVQSATQAQISEQTLKNVLDNQKIVEQKKLLGTASDVDVSNIKVQVAQQKLNTLRANNNTDEAKELLCSIIRFPLDTQFAVDTNLFIPQAGDIRPLESYLDKSANLSILQSQKSLLSSEWNRVSAWLEYVPSVTVSSGWSWSGDNFKTSLPRVSDEATYNWKVGLSWTLFGATARYASVKTAISQVEQSRLSLENTGQTIEKSIRSAYRTMVESASGYELTNEQIQYANLTLVAAKKRYELGSITLLDLLQAELNFQSAQNDRIAAISNFYKSKIALEKLIGK